MAAVIGGQIDAVGLVIGGDDDGADVRDGVLAQVLLVDAEHVGWGGDDCLEVVVELIAIDVTEVARFGDAQDDGLEESVEAAEQLLRRDFLKIPWADGVLDGLEDRVLANALITPENDGVIDFSLGALNPLRKPCDDVFGVVGPNGHDRSTGSPVSHRPA